jgi:hypothetical protein
MEIRPLAQFDFFADVTVNKRIESVKEEKTWDSNPVFIVGTELLFTAEFAPIRYGIGLGFKSRQKKGSHTITPAFLPIWGNVSFGFYGKDWFAVPYAAVRAGTMGALTGEGSWWERPFNFFVVAGIGAIFPYNIGFEVNFDYSSVHKSFEHRDTNAEKDERHNEEIPHVNRQKTFQQERLLRCLSFHRSHPSLMNCFITNPDLFP